jgi:hypothetical protein
LVFLAVALLQVGVGGGMKSGVAFWSALKSFKEIHPCWAHLNGTPLVEADLPRPISTEYKSVFDLPSTRTAQEQAETQAKTDAVSRTTVVAASENNRLELQGSQIVEVLAAALRHQVAASEDSKIESQGSRIDVQNTLKVLAASLHDQVEGGWTISAQHEDQEREAAAQSEESMGAIPYRMSEMTVI